MTEIEMYKETLKAVHNQYIKVLRKVENAICKGYLSDEIPRADNVGIDDALILTHATCNVLYAALKDSCDTALKTIESEMEK